MALSTRGKANADQCSIPWRSALPHTYDPNTNPSGLISFATAENWLVQSELCAFTSNVHISSEAYRYAFSTAGGPRLPSAFAAHMNECFDPYWELNGEDIKVSAAATSMHDILAYSLCAGGEGILTSRPYYGRFELDFGNKAGAKLVTVDTDHEGCFDEGVVEVFQRTLRKSEIDGVKTSAMLVINPHNPLGKCYPRNTLIALMRFCQANDLHFISDEVYALSTFNNPDCPITVPFTSVLSIDPTDIIEAERVHVIYSMSKDFGAAGLKTGCLVTRNHGLKKAITAVQRFSGIGGPSVAIATAILEDRTWCGNFITISRQRLGDAYVYVTNRLKQMGINFMKGGTAGFFVWVDLSPLLPPSDGVCDDTKRQQMLAQEFVMNGVFLQPGEEHGRVGWFRMVFSMEREVVDEGLKRLKKAIATIRW